MLTHIVTIRLREDATERQVQSLVHSLEKLPDRIPEVRAYTVGRDMGLIAGNCDLVIVAEFASTEDLRTYIAHPAHVKLVREVLEPISTERTRIQFPGTSHTSVTPDGEM